MVGVAFSELDYLLFAVAQTARKSWRIVSGTSLPYVQLLMPAESRWRKSTKRPCASSQEDSTEMRWSRRALRISMASYDMNLVEAVAIGGSLTAKM